MPRKRVAAKLTENIHNCYEQQFTGLLKITEHTGKPWYVYFLLGRITWAQSSRHPLRSWKRHLAVHSPVLSEQINEPVSLYYEYWNYAALARLVRLKQFPREQFSKVVEGCVTEVLFDILQAGIWQIDKAVELVIENQPKEAASMPFIMLENLQTWEKAQHDWQRWEQAGLTKLSPNWAPLIKLPEDLKAQTPLQTFQTLTSFANGENTLRDLAVRFKQPIIPIAKSIRPYVGRQLLEFAEIPDIVDSAHHGFHPEMMEVHQAPSRADGEDEIADEPQLELSLPSLPISEPPNQEASNRVSAGHKESTGGLSKAEDSPNETPTLSIERTSEKLTGRELQSEELTKATASRETASKEPASKELANQDPASKELTKGDNKESASKETINQETASEGKTSGKLPTKESPPGEQLNELQEGLVYQRQTKQTQVIDKRVPGTPTQTKGTQPNPNAKRSDKSKAKKKTINNLPKVIYIDDSPADSRAMATIVEKLGYQYINIPDPLQALPMLIELKPRLIFLDLVMPIANGYEVCAQIRRISAFKKIPVIIVTSNDGIADRVRAKIVGASGFMGKPIQEKRILKVFKKHLSNNTSQ